MKGLRDCGDPSWKKLVATAAFRSAAAVLVVRNFFETEKKIKHPIRADYAAGDEVFVRTMGRLLGRKCNSSADERKR